MTDWKKMEEEFVTGGVGYRALGRKYGIPYSTVNARGKKEGWPVKRMEYEMARAGEPEPEECRNRTARYLAVSDRLLDQTALAIAQQQTPASLKTLSEVMKNIRDIQMIRSSQDRKEQQARTDKLRKEADREVFAGERITVVLEGAAEEFAE